MESSEYLAHLRRDGAALAATAGGRLSDPVPSMPGYDLGSLLLHVGGHCWYVIEAIERRSPPDTSAIAPGDDPAAWYHDQHGRMVELLTSAAADDPAWSWAGSDQQHVGFWIRRTTQEHAVHRWDAENATGDPSPLDAPLAADGIDELLDLFAPAWNFATDFGGGGETIHLHATDGPPDVGGEWLIRAQPDHLEVSREHAKGDVAARGSASDLLLFLWGRVPPDRVEVFGTADLLRRWQEQVHI